MPVERFMEDDSNGTFRVSFSYPDLFKYQQNDRSTRGCCTRPLMRYIDRGMPSYILLGTQKTSSCKKKKT